MSEEKTEVKEPKQAYDLQKIEVGFENGVAVPSSFSQLMHMARGLALVSAFPNYTKMGEYVTCVMAAAEIRRSPNYVYNNTWQNKGKIYFYGDHIDAEVLKSDKLESLTENEITDKEGNFLGIEVEVSRKGGLKMKTKFTIQDAKTAGLLGKDNWKNYPKDMCFQRAKNKAYRRLFADFLQGAKSIEDSEFEPEVKDVTPNKLASAAEISEKLGGADE